MDGVIACRDRKINLICLLRGEDIIVFCTFYRLYLQHPFVVICCNNYWTLLVPAALLGAEQFLCCIITSPTVLKDYRASVT